MRQPDHRSRGTRTVAMWGALLVGLAAGLLFLAAAPASVSALTRDGAQTASDPRIIGGVEVDPPGKYPFMAALVRRGGDPYDDQYCGGSVISPNWVLTAAHCVVGESASTVDVVIGRHDLSSGAGERIAASRIVIHPSYDDISLENDLALIRLASPTSFAPVGLPADTSLETAGTMLTVAGWGDTMSIPQWPYELREVDLPVVGDAACRNAYADFDYTGYVLPSAVMFCAGDLAAGGIDSCPGDSGGPLFATTAQGFTQVGIVSWGNGCGLAGYPGVYTRVSAFTGWIADQTGSGPPGSATCLGVAATIVGTSAGETINGTAGADVIVGLGGNDIINGGGGNDLICGNDGNDTINGGAGNDTVQGGAGNDTIVGGPGDDVLKGGPGADNITGGAGIDTLFGEGGNDTLDGGDGIDTVTGGPGTDTCYGETKTSCELPLPSGIVCDSPAVAIGLGVAVQSQIQATDQPYPANATYYCVEVPAGTGGVTIDLTGMSADLDLYVGFGSIESVLGLDAWEWSSAAGGTADEQVVINQPDPGVYYIEVLSYDRVFSAFTLLVVAS
jgi:trypsin